MQNYLTEHSKAKYDILKCQSKIHKLLEKIIDRKLDASEYPFMGDKPAGSKLMGENSVLRGAAIGRAKGGL